MHRVLGPVLESWVRIEVLGEVGEHAESRGLGLTPSITRVWGGVGVEGCHGLDAPRFCTSSTHLCLNSYADLLEGPPRDRERNAAQTGGLWAAECFQR